MEDEAYEKCEKAAKRQVTLAHRNINLRLCVYTVVSDLLWLDVVTQVPLVDLNNAHVDQNRQPLAFLSGRFPKSQPGWSILEKEAFAIMVTIECML